MFFLPDLCVHFCIRPEPSVIIHSPLFAQSMPCCCPVISFLCIAPSPPLFLLSPHPYHPHDTHLCPFLTRIVLCRGDHLKNSNVFLASLQYHMTEALFLNILHLIFWPFTGAYSCNCFFSQYLDSFWIPTPAPCDMCETGVDVGGGAFRSHLAQVSVALLLLLQLLLLLLLLLPILQLLPLSAGVHCTLAQRIEARG